MRVAVLLGLATGQRYETDRYEPSRKSRQSSKQASEEGSDARRTEHDCEGTSPLKEGLQATKPRAAAVCFHATGSWHTQSAQTASQNFRLWTNLPLLSKQASRRIPTKRSKCARALPVLLQLLPNDNEMRAHNKWHTNHAQHAAAAMFIYALNCNSTHKKQGVRCHPATVLHWCLQSFVSEPIMSMLMHACMHGN